MQNQNTSISQAELLQNKFPEVRDFLIKKFPEGAIVRQAYECDDDMINHLLSGDVTVLLSDAILWVAEEREKKNELPSRFKIGDKVSIRLRPMFVVDTAEVIKIHFTESKVFYDLDVEFDYPTPPDDGKKGVTRIYNVDSAMLSEH